MPGLDVAYAKTAPGAATPELDVHALPRRRALAEGLSHRCSHAPKVFSPELEVAVRTLLARSGAGTPDLHRPPLTWGLRVPPIVMDPG